MEKNDHPLHSDESPHFNIPDHGEGDQAPPVVGPHTTSNTEAHGPPDTNGQSSIAHVGPDAPLSVGHSEGSGQASVTEGADSQSDGSVPRPHSSDISEKMKAILEHTTEKMIGGNEDEGDGAPNSDQPGTLGELEPTT